MLCERNSKSYPFEKGVSRINPSYCKAGTRDGGNQSIKQGRLNATEGKNESGLEIIGTSKNCTYPYITSIHNNII
jgi:hypothetical protein